jgi:hypothetical protein
VTTTKKAQGLCFPVLLLDYPMKEVEYNFRNVVILYPLDDGQQKGNLTQCNAQSPETFKLQLKLSFSFQKVMNTLHESYIIQALKPYFFESRVLKEWLANSMEKSS